MHFDHIYMKMPKAEVTHCINRNKMADNGEKKIKILIFKTFIFHYKRVQNVAQ